MMTAAQSESPTQRITSLTFVYDADSGTLSAVADSLKKLVGGGCPLCVVTHGLTGRRKEWDEVEASFHVPITYLHRDQTLGRIVEPAPCIVADVEGETEQVVLMDAAALDRCKGTPADLQGRLRFRAASLGLSFG